MRSPVLTLSLFDLVGRFSTSNISIIKEYQE